MIEDEKGYVWKYMHLETSNVKQGDKVSVGSVIGTVGNTGDSTEPNLYLETTCSDFLDSAT